MSSNIINKELNINEIKEILKQLNNEFKIMYNNTIIHRDIKPENFLIKKLENNKYLYKLTDYGFSKQLTQKIIKHNLNLELMIIFLLKLKLV